MTFYANRHNVEPILRGISLVMMIFFCLCGAVMALQGVRPEQFTSSDSITHSLTGLMAFGMPNLITANITKTSSLAFFSLLIVFLAGLAFFASFVTTTNRFAFFALEVAFSANFVFLCLLVLPVEVFLACFALVLIAIFFATVFTKFREMFGLLALVATFGYDWFRHGFLLFRKLCLEPRQTQYLCGSFYFNERKKDVK